MPRAPLTAVEEVYRDAHLLVLSKPAGLPTTRPDAGDCLVARARALDPTAPSLHALSRLDVMVTGLVAFARTREQNHACLQARRAGRFERCYVALSAHAPTPDAGEWRWPIGVLARDRRLREALPEGHEGEGVRPSVTRYAVSGEAGGLCALRLWPETGRTHQLRVHAARAGAPLFGDTAYTGARRLTLADGAVLASRRVQLHCAWLRIPGLAAPGGTLELSASPLPDMATLWRTVGGDMRALSGGAPGRQPRVGRA